MFAWEYHKKNSRTVGNTKLKFKTYKNLLKRENCKNETVLVTEF